MQDSKPDQEKYAELSTQYYLGELIYGIVLLKQNVPKLNAHFC